MSTTHARAPFILSRHTLTKPLPPLLHSLACTALGLLGCVGSHNDWSGPAPQGAQQPGSSGIATWDEADADADCDASLTITEVHPNPLGSDADGSAEYVEITGTAGTSLSGWSLRFVNGADGAVYAQVGLQGVVPDSGVLAIYGGAANTFGSALPRPLQQGPDAVELLNCRGQLAQLFEYPAAGNDDGELPEGISMCWCGGSPLTCAATPGVSGPATCDSIGPCHDSCTTDRTEQTADVGFPSDAGGYPTEDADWSDGTDTMDAWVDAARVQCNGASQQGIRIQEILFDPSGADSLDTEFVELAVPAGETTLGLRLVHWDAGSGAEVWSVDLEAEPSPIVVLGGVDGASAALPGMLQNGPDAVWIEDCAGTVLDVVVYGLGEAALPTWLDPASQPALEGRASHSLAACDGGRDSQGWFRGAAAVPSPGAPNDAWLDASACQPPCTGAPIGSALIQEVLFNPEGADAGFEFIEIVGVGSVLPGGLQLRFINGSNGEAWAAPLLLDTAAVGAGLWVIGGDQIPESQQLLPTTLQNGPDGIQLWSCDGTLLDTVGWGETSGAPVWVEAGGLEGVREGCSMTRNASSRDTQDNRRDFASDCTPTPGRR